MNSRIRKFAYIDSLRGIAILFVLMGHTSMWIGPCSTVIDALTSTGGRGVQLFFLVSALTLCLSINSRSRKENHPLRSFFIRRFFRIAPLFYLAIVFYYWISPWKIEIWKPATSFLFLHGFHPKTINGVVPGGWSIAVEMIFYLFLPFLYSFFNNARKALTGFFLFTFGALLLSNLLYQIYLPAYTGENEKILSEYFFFWFPNQLPVFMLGILLFHIIRHPTDDMKKWSIPILIAALYILAAFMKSNYVRLLPHHLLYGIGFALLTYSLSMNPLPIIVNQITVWLGKLSFSIYLAHFAILSFYSYHFPNGILFEKTPGLIVSFLVLTSTTTLVSIVTYNLIEKPGIRLGKYVIKKLEFRNLVLPQSKKQNFQR